MDHNTHVYVLVLDHEHDEFDIANRIETILTNEAKSIREAA